MTALGIWATDDPHSFEDHKINMEIVRALVYAGANVNESDPHNGWTPIMIAVSHSYTEIVKLLLYKGADVNKRDINGMTALMIAVIANDRDNSGLVKLLLVNRADPNAMNIAGIRTLALVHHVISIY